MSGTGARLARRITALLTAATVLWAASTASAVRFTASGDFGSDTSTGSPFGAVLDQIGSVNGNAFHLALGDLTYARAGGEQAWCDAVRGRVGSTLPFEFVTGNHDSGMPFSGGGYEPIIETFVASGCLPNGLPLVQDEYPRRWYVDIPQGDPVMRLVVGSPGITFRDPKTGVRTQDRYLKGSPGYEWMAETINAARRSGIRWVVTSVHFPCLSPGDYECRADGFSMGPDLMALFVGKRVDLVLTGHEHLYARSHQLGYGTGCPDRTVLRPLLKNESASAAAACIRNATNRMTKGRGTVFAIVGTGGRLRAGKLYEVDLTDNELGYFAAWSGENVGRSFGNLVVDVTAAKLHATFVPSPGGSFSDTFTITAPPPADFDRDGVPDARDLCRRLRGPATRQGCPLRFLGTARRDRIVGTRLRDIVVGYGGGDFLRGSGRNDTISGGPGRDLLIGDGGSDVLIGGRHSDRMYGGPGNDRLIARDGVRDLVNCGPGRDIALVDRVDVVRGCERVRRG